MPVKSASRNNNNNNNNRIRLLPPEQLGLIGRQLNCLPVSFRSADAPLDQKRGNEVKLPPSSTCSSRVPPGRKGGGSARSDTQLVCLLHEAKLFPSLSTLSGLPNKIPNQLMDNEGTIVDEKGMEQMKFDEEITEDNHAESETGTTFRLDECTQHPTKDMEQVVMDNLGRLFEHCIQQVSCLEKERDELIREFLHLQEPFLRVVEHLRRKLVEAQKLLTLTQLDYMAVFEGVQQVKRKLFVAARDCIQSQVTLAAHEYEVAQSAVTQEELKTHIQSLTRELSQLQQLHENHLNSLRDQLTKPCRPRAMTDVSQCRQASVRLQRRLSGSVMALEGWYEPRVMALLKRRQIGEEALRKSREEVNDLKARLGPLRQDMQRQEVQRSCLEQRISLMERDRHDSNTQHKETVETLRETLRELEVEFEVQRKSKKYLEDLKDGLLTELTFLRGCDEANKTTGEEEP